MTMVSGTPQKNQLFSRDPMDAKLHAEVIILPIYDLLIKLLLDFPGASGHWMSLVLMLSW
jgi:hypothetical protein